MVLGSWRPVGLAGAGRLERRVRPHCQARLVIAWRISFTSSAGLGNDFGRLKCLV